jgi:hypothetical protein
MDNKPSEIKNLMSAQNSKLQQIKVQESLLLEAAKETEKYEDLKKILGWNETDKVLDAEKREIMEYASRVEDCKSNEVLTALTVKNYCIENNYVLCRLDMYKGRIEESFLESIHAYLRENNLTISDPNLKMMYVLCPFTDTKANNHSIKKSKRYNKYRSPKIILLHRLDNGNEYHNEHFRIVSEHGSKNLIWNFIKSLFLTHTRTGNMAFHALVYTVVILVFILGMFVIAMFQNYTETTDPAVVHNFSSILISSLALIMILKMFIPILRDMGYYDTTCEDPFFSINIFNDKGYEKIDFNKNSWFSTSFMGEYFLTMPFSAKWRVFVGRVIIIATFYFLCMFLVKECKVVIFALKGPAHTQEWINKEAKIYKRYTWDKTSPFSYGIVKEESLKITN